MVYASLCKDEEAFYKQKSRVKWLDVGEKNTAYFFKKVTGHKVRNKVMSINTLEGDRVCGEENVHKEAIAYFSQILGTEQQLGSHIGRLQQVIDKRLNTNEQRDLCNAVTEEEIKAALFSISNQKAPGPDGYSATFFKQNWDCVGGDLVTAVKEFFYQW
ncbi:hypothetical protein LguiA_030334 [Lonicera macranthoides]